MSQQNFRIGPEHIRKYVVNRPITNGYMCVSKESAEAFEEATFSPSDDTVVSRATMTTTRHEKLYISKSGDTFFWIESWSDDPDDPLPSARAVSVDEAACWFHLQDLALPRRVGAFALDVQR